MGTKVHCESYTPGYYSIRDMNEDLSTSIWSPFHGDKNLLNGHYCEGFMQRTVRDRYPENEKDVLKVKMIEHDTVFKNQVYELHRIYRVQREMMEEARRKELYNHHRSVETSLSSSILPSQRPFDEVRNWQTPSFPLAKPSCARPSILGSEVIELPSSCMKLKGHNSEADLVPYRNKCDQKDLVCLDSRSLKVKKSLFNHQISADKYATEREEHFQDIEMSSARIYPTSSDHRLSQGNSTGKYTGGGKTNDLGDTLSDLSPKIPMLADLNEPVQVEGNNLPEIVDVSGRSASYGDIKGLNFTAKSKSQFIDLSRDLSHNSKGGRSNGNFVDLSETNKGTRRGWLSCMYEAGNRGADANFVPTFYQSEQLPTPSPQMPFMPGQPNLHQGILPTDHAKEETRTERNLSYELSNRSCGRSNYNPSESVVTSHISKSHQWHNSSNVANSWSHSVTSWEKPKSISTEKVTSPYARPSKTSNGDINGSSRLNPSLGSKLPMQNEMCLGSSLVSTGLSTKASSFGYASLKCNEIDAVPSKHLTGHGLKNVLRESDIKNLKPVKGLDLNAVLPIESSDEETLPQSNEILDGKRKYRDPNPDLPWLRGKPMCNVVSTITRNKLDSGLPEASYNQLLKDETVKDSNSLPIAASNSCHVRVDRGSASAAVNNGKLLGFPVFGNFCTLKNDSASVQSSCNNVSTKTKGNYRGFDINVACNLVDEEFNKQIGEEAILSEKGNDTKVNNFRNIDLNSCVSEDEDILVSSHASTSGKVKIAFEIDLEAPAVQNTADALFPVEEQKLPEGSLQSKLHKTEQQKDQAVKYAAETIVAISSYSRDPHIECTKLDRSELPDSLTWFADVISSSAEELERKLCKDYEGRNCREIEAPRELDDYEVMTLQLTETREEDYMPEPFVPEIPNLEVGATSVPSRTRKGPARRGRIRKDFQRDVLPGLVSLSRHEVTEDLQTFGGLMRATGHQWNGGTTRRNGTRGRRRCIVDPSPSVVVAPVCNPLLPNFNGIEARVEDVSLTGWGKTTRRPRRQRSAATNNPAVAMT
ncbi:hypothetical protein DCAR_0935944 [Daucus carota subsp. sativus]|uniref:Uncharacterized protein n=1 Tax=Daucus carota subsp. sativus TaxID=79200 RepID=A0A175YJT3_DAUCS|nr:PREDICTED: uncharacterized protein LOC108202516 [Daucus carota subsp. sativus]WOH16391.1 hypothetical protein DCAR_0935944 [Daucus carota subsp. sativus]